MEIMDIFSIYGKIIPYFHIWRYLNISARPISNCMTAKQTPEKPSRYWHEAFESIKGRNDVKVHLLLHLLHGEDYAYNIAKFCSGSSIELNPLCDQSQIQPILSDMEKKGFLLSRKPPSVRKIKYFLINPAILQSPAPGPYHIPIDGEDVVFSIREEDIKKFFAALKKVNRTYPAQSGTTKFDFVTFLIAVGEKAKGLGFEDLGKSIDTYIAEVGRLEREKRRINSLEFNVVAYVAPRKE